MGSGSQRHPVDSQQRRSVSEAIDLAGSIGELRAWALIYAEAGLEVFPVHPSGAKAKAPITSQYDATTDGEIIEAWWTRWPTALIGHRLAEDLVVLDIDPRHGGKDTWEALREAIGGKWPITRYHSSGRGDGGGHTWWLRPADDLSIGGLDAWAEERKLGHAASDTRWVSGIDLLQRQHRYTILPPSPHPDTAQPYTWRKGLEVAPSPMPVLLADLLTEKAAPTPTSRPRPPADPDSIADWYSDAHSWARLLGPRGWTLRAGDGDADGSRWRHPVATSAFSATVRHGCLFVFSPNTAFDVTEPGKPHGYTRFGAWTILEHGGDGKAAARAAREAKDGPRQRHDDDLRDLLPAVVGSRDSTESDDDDVSPYIPQVVWDSRPSLSHIQQAARARLVAPDAVLGAMLARVAAITPHTVELPALVGRATGLSFFCVLCGPPESGKSAAAGVAHELLPAPARVLDLLPIGTGEGMVEVLFEMVDDVNEAGKPVKVKRQTRFSAIFHIDEGQALADLGSRSGSTLMPTLRSAWTHGTLGNANASVERRRILEGHRYVYGITMGIQPEMAGPLLSDTAGGTPQRFVWFMATDPGAIEGVEWPGELPWEPPEPGVLEAIAVTRAGWRRHQLEVDPAIADEVIADRLRALRTDEGEASEAHRMLARLKIAALLGILDGRLDVNMEDWKLADLIWLASREVRRGVERTLITTSAAKDRAGALRVAHREMTIEDTKAHRALISASRSVGNIVARHAGTGGHTDPAGCIQRCLARAIGSKYRVLVSVDEAIEEAIRNGWVEGDGGRFIPGKSRPA